MKVYECDKNGLNKIGTFSNGYPIEKVVKLSDLQDQKKKLKEDVEENYYYAKEFLKMIDERLGEEE